MCASVRHLLFLDYTERYMGVDGYTCIYFAIGAYIYCY